MSLHASSEQPLLGRVLVVAGEEPALAAVAATATDAGARVAVVSHTLPPDVKADVRFRTDPAAVDTWDRVAMHVEQHLGPVDGVATDAPTFATVSPVFAPDLARRGHGDVVVVTSETGAAEALSQMVGTPRGEPARPGAAGQDR